MAEVTPFKLTTYPVWRPILQVAETSQRLYSQVGQNVGVALPRELRSLWSENWQQSTDLHESEDYHYHGVLEKCSKKQDGRLKASF